MHFLEWNYMNFDRDFTEVFVPWGPINSFPALVQIMAWRRPGDKPLSEPMLVCLLTHICITWPQWVKSGQSERTHLSYDDVMAWEDFQHYWPFVRWIHQWLVDSHHKGLVMQRFGIFLLQSCTCCWINSQSAHALDRQNAHVMSFQWQWPYTTKHSIATITQLRSLELLTAKPPQLHMLYYMNRLTHDFWTRTGGWEFDCSHGTGTSSPSHWQQVEEQVLKPVGWMMCFLLMTFVPVQKLCVNIYIYMHFLYTSSVTGRIYTYNRSVIRYWWSCTPSHSIGLYFWGVRSSWLNATFCFLWFTNCVLLSDDNSLIPGCLWLLVFVLNNILILGIWCSTIPHLPGCFCPWTFFQNIGFNMVPSDPFMSHLAAQLGYSAGEFQALQLIVLVAFGVVD